MRRYETIFILDPDLADEQRGALFERLDALIKQYKGMAVERDEWGARKLAYDIRGRNRGYYVRLDYCGEGALVDEMERSFRIDDNVLKFMTIVLEKDADLDQIKEEMAKAAAEQAEAAQKSAEAAPAQDQPAAENTETSTTDAETSTTDTEKENEEA
jgi:small subunit ribosomal protein S6